MTLLARIQCPLKLSIDIESWSLLGVTLHTAGKALGVGCTDTHVS